jgi:hypothetical protein
MTDSNEILAHVQEAGAQAGMRDPADLAAYVDVDSLAIDTGGKIAGLDKIIADLREGKPYLFKTPVYNPNSSKTVHVQLEEHLEQARAEELAHGTTAVIDRLKQLDVALLKDNEFGALRRTIDAGYPSVGDQATLEAAAQRHADARETERRRLNQAI